MSNLPREIRIVWDCLCGAHWSTTFDLKARPHGRTHQCSLCKRTLEIHRPRLVDLTPPAGGAR